MSNVPPQNKLAYYRNTACKNVAYFKEDMPGVPVELVPNAGHFPQEEQPDTFNRLALAFLQGRLPA